MSAQPLEHLFVFGAGGSAREIAWLARGIHGSITITFVVDQRRYLAPPIDGSDVILMADLADHSGHHFVAAVGDPALRRAAADGLSSRGLTPLTLVHPGVDLTGRLRIADGSVVYPGAVLTTDVIVGRHVQVNSGTTVSHDVTIGDFATLGPGAHVAGHVTIAEGATVGAGATIVNGTAAAPLRIGAESVVAAGACVTRPVEDGALVAGVPAVRKR